MLTGTYCCCFQVTAPQVASLNLAFAVDNVVPSAWLNGAPLPFFLHPIPGWTGLGGRMVAGSALFQLGTNVLVVKVLNTYGPYGFYAESTANCPPAPPPPAPPPPCKFDGSDEENCPPPPPPPPCSSFDGLVWSGEFQEWVFALFQMADADGSGTVNDRDELAMLLSFLNLKPSEACADKLNRLLKQSLAGISFSDFFKWLKVCLPARHVWRDCPPSAPPPSPPPCGKYVTAEGGVAFSHHCPPPPPPSSPPPYCATLLDFVLVLDESG